MSNVLTEKQKRFCREYLLDSNGKQAAIRAGYSAKTAEVQASKMLSIPKVSNFLKSIQQKVSDKLEITLERTLLEIARIAFSDTTALFNADGTLKEFGQMTEDQKALFASMEVDEISTGKGKGKKGQTRKFKTWDKTKCLEMLAKHFGLFEKDNDQQRPVFNANKIVFK